MMRLNYHIQSSKRSYRKYRILIVSIVKMLRIM